MQSDDPPFLVVGTEVSAKFKGAFCEAKVKKIVKSVKCKVLLKETPFGSVTVEDTNIHGKLELNQLVEVAQGKNAHKGVIQYIKDCSTYTVVFNDGDERVLRRTQVCLKGGKHFDSAVNLDTMPLYHPDSFANSISRDKGKKVLKRKAAASSDEEDEETLISSSPTSSRRSVRRSASVTPLKGIASTRSATRAIAALKYDDCGQQSKSPTPARSTQPPRASSVMVSARRLAALNRTGRNSADGLKSNAEDEGNSEENDSDDCELKSNTKNLQTKSKSTVKELDDEQRENYVGGMSKDSKTGTKKQSNSHSESGSSSISSVFVSSAATSLSTVANVGKAATTSVNNSTNTSSSSRLTMVTKDKSDASIGSTTSPVSGCAVQKETKKERKQKCVDGGAENSSSDSIDKRFPPGSVVVINEFVPPKIGGRIQLGLVVSVKEYKAHILNNKVQQLPNLGKRQISVRIFQNGRYHVADLNHLSTFNPVEFRKMTDTSTSCLKIAFERANLYYTKRELPQSWEKKPITKESSTTFSNDNISKKDKDKDKEKEKQRPAKKAETSSEEESSESEEEDNDYNERRDRFVAHFYKFQDESGNPMNRVPVLGGKEIDLYRFYDIVNRLGGHKRVTLESRWRRVLTKLRLEDCSGATPHTVKNAYLRYFEKFEAFMKHLGYSSLNDAASSSTSTRSSRTIRTSYDMDWKKNAEKRKEKRAREKSETVGKDRSFSKGSSVEISQAKIAKLSTPLPSLSTDSQKSTEILASPNSCTSSPISRSGSNSTVTVKTEPTIAKEEPPPPPTSSSSSIVPSSGTFLNTHIKTESRSTDVKPGIEHKKPTKHSSTSSIPEFKPSKISREDSDLDKSKSNSRNSDSTSMVGTSSSSTKIKDKRTKALSKRESHDSDITMTSSDEEVVKRFQKQQHRRRGGSSSGKEDRVKSPLGHHAVEEQDIGYSNANIFTRFYQGQKVHARHHLRFYDARIVIVKQPSLSEISKSLVNAFELGKITHASCTDLDSITLRNMGNELKDALKNMVNATKCFVHYLGWNSRYDEWLMLHKIRVDEKDDKASTKALDSLIPNELPPQLFAVAMDWCESSEGIPSLAHTHAYASDQQRPRRLSSSAAAAVAGSSGRGKSSSTSSNETASSSASGSTAAAAAAVAATTSTSGSGFHYQSKYATHHTTINKQSTNSSACGNNSSTSSLVSSSFSYHSPLSSVKSSVASNFSFLTVSTTTSSTTTSCQDSVVSSCHGSHSPRSPLQYSRLSTSNLKHDESVAKLNATNSGNIGGTVKFTIPHIQHGQRAQLTRTTTADSSSPLVTTGTTSGVLIQGLSDQPESSSSTPLTGGTLILPSVILTGQNSSVNYGPLSGTNPLTPMNIQQFYQSQTGTQTKSNMLPGAASHLNSGMVGGQSLPTAATNVVIPPGALSAPPFPPQITTLPITKETTQTMQATLQQQQSSMFQSQTAEASTTAKLNSCVSSSSPIALTRLLLPPPPPPPSLPTSSSSIALQFGTSTSSSVIPYSVVITSSTAQNLRADSVALDNAGNTEMPLMSASEIAMGVSMSPSMIKVPQNECIINLEMNTGISNKNMGEAVAVASCSNDIRYIFTIKQGGKLIEQQEILLMDEKLASTSQQTSSQATTIRSGSVDVVDPMLLMVRSSPLTTVSSCGAVEDFDENSSIRHTETPMNDDDECASIASNDTKSVTSSSKTLGSPPRQRSLLNAKQRSTPNQQKNVVQAIKGMNRNHSKSPCGSGNGTVSGQLPPGGNETRVATPRSLRRCASKSPDSSAAEDNYEEQVTHTDSSHAVRIRVLQRMEAEHLFASYSFLGLPELELQARENRDIKSVTETTKDSITIENDEEKKTEELLEK